MTRTEKQEEQKLQQFLRKNGGQPIGCLAERSPETGLYDAVTGTLKSVMTGRRLPSGTRIKLWSGAIAVVPA